MPAVIDQSNKSLDADVGRTGGLAWGGSSFAYSECSGNSLWILFENCFTKIELFVVFVGGRNRTDLCALTTARAFAKVYISGLLVNFCSKTSRLAFDAQKLGVCKNLNIQMTADLDQFR
jgi:hypothetical protein